MKSKVINTVDIQGKLYSFNKLEETESKKTPGLKFINGSVSIATDPECMNVVEVKFIYQRPTTGGLDGKPVKVNANYAVLKNIIDGTLKTVVESGADEAALIKVTGSVASNDFAIEEDGEYKIVSPKMIRGSFIHVVAPNEFKYQNSFKTDMVITECRRVEADDEHQRPEQVRLKGCVFGFRNAISPVEYCVLNQKAMSYFEGLDISPKTPVFTEIRGIISSTTSVRTIEEENGWGETEVREVPVTNKDYVVTFARAELYEWDTEATITSQELTELMQDREVRLAEIKANRMEYDKGRTPTATPQTSGKPVYNF